MLVIGSDQNLGGQVRRGRGASGELGLVESCSDMKGCPNYVHQAAEMPKQTT